MKKKSKLQLLQEKAQMLVNNINEEIEELGENTNILSASLNMIQEQFDTIRNIPSNKMNEYEEIKKIELEWKQSVQKIEENYEKNAKIDKGIGTVGAGIGATVATMGSTIAMGVATTFGVASTGTAISTLSGAAATKAALAWLGGGALASGGGGISAGTFLLALAGPVGWSIAGITLTTSGFLFWKNKKDQSRLEEIFSIITERDIKTYELVETELNERISKVLEESNGLNVAIEKIKTFGTDYNKMDESQQYELGAYVNLMLSSTQLLVNPIKGLIPKYTEVDFDNFCNIKDDDNVKDKKNIIIPFANLLYDIDLNEDDKKLLHKSFIKNKELLKKLNITKKDFSYDSFNNTFDALEKKYNNCI